MRSLLAALLFAFTATPAIAAWEKLFEGGTVHRHVDPKTIVKDDTADGYRTALVLSEYKLSAEQFKKTHPDGTRSMVSLMEYDCKRNSARELAFFSYTGSMGDGRLVNAGPNVADWFDATKNPAFAPVARFVCGR